MMFLWISFCLCGILSQFTNGQSKSDEARLYTSLMSRYSDDFRHVRPMTDSSKNLTVGVGVSLVDILEADPVTGIVKLLVFERFSWKDDHLTWQPNMFGGMDKIRLPNNLVWKPDMTLYDNLEANGDRMLNSAIVVDNEGNVLWVPRATYPIRCNVTLDGDYDCQLRYGSWVYDGFLIDFEHFGGEDKVDVNDFRVHYNWDILENTVTKVNKYYDCCKEPYPTVNARLLLRYKGPTNSANMLCSGLQQLLLAMMGAIVLSVK